MACPPQRHRHTPASCPQPDGSHSERFWCDTEAFEAAKRKADSRGSLARKQSSNLLIKQNEKGLGYAWIKLFKQQLPLEIGLPGPSK